MSKCENCYHAEICKNYPNTGLPPKMRQELVNKGCEHYKDKSLIIELPCKAGDTVYIEGEALIIDLIHVDNTVTFCTSFNCYERYCGDCPFYKDEVSWEGEHDCVTQGYLEFTTNDIGKTVFLSREEAERALKEREKNGDEMR